MGQVRLLKILRGDAGGGHCILFPVPGQLSAGSGLDIQPGYGLQLFLIHNLYLASRQREAILTLAFILLMLGDFHVGLFNISDIFL